MPSSPYSIPCSIFFACLHYFLSYFILAVRMTKCHKGHSCVRRMLFIAMLNGTCIFTILVSTLIWFSSTFKLNPDNNAMEYKVASVCVCFFISTKKYIPILCEDFIEFINNYNYSKEKHLITPNSR